MTDADTEALVERVADGICSYLTEQTGFQTLDSDGRVSAYYGGRWIYLDPAAIAIAALAAIDPAAIEYRAYERAAGDDGYRTAFYELAELMGIGARTQSPSEVWRTVMLPRIQAAFP